MIYTKGYLSDSKGSTPREGRAFVFNRSRSEVVSAPVKNEGPGGQAHKQTVDRAELHAVIAALKFQAWWGKGRARVVITTASYHVVNGATRMKHS